MRYSKILALIFTTIFLSSCVLIQESKNKKRLESVEYETVYKDDDDEDFVFEEEIPNTNTKETEITDNNKVAAKTQTNPNEIWYHPNPWWRIESKPFLVSKDSLKIRRYAPQYGFANYVDPVTKSISNEWSTWLDNNNLNSYGNSVTHSWVSFINKYKKEFESHPEYLSEKDGQRPGYGNTNKLCVSNKSVQNLFVEYIKDRIKATPELDIYSVEPADGAGFCTCANCKKLGSISNQVYFLANVVAKEIKKTYPQKQIGILAYNFHSEVPDFKLEDNLKVVVAPQGYQTIYSPLGIMDAWKKAHNNLGFREYFGIVQRTGDQPRINVQYFLSVINYAQQNNFDMMIYESGANINAVIIASLLSKIMMNPSLTWEEVFNKFLDDSFKDSKVPVKRLLTRWHSYNSMDENEINYSLYDLREAASLAKNPNELQRIRDLKAYVHYLVLYKEWNVKREDINATKKYFDYVYISSNRNIVNVTGLVKLFAKYYKSDQELNTRYIASNKKKEWVNYISDSDIEKNFEADIKKYAPQKMDFLPIAEFDGILAKTPAKSFLSSYSSNIKSRNSQIVYSKNNTLTIKPTYKQDGTKTLISVTGNSGKFVEQKFLNNNESWAVKLPNEGIYTVTQTRVSAVNVNFEGQFLILSETTSTGQEAKYNVYTISSNKQLQKTDRIEKIKGSAPYYIIGNLNIDK